MQHALTTETRGLWTRRVRGCTTSWIENGQELEGRENRMGFQPAQPQLIPDSKPELSHCPRGYMGTNGTRG